MSIFKAAKVLLQSKMQSAGLVPYCIVEDDVAANAPRLDPPLVRHVRAGRWAEAQALAQAQKVDELHNVLEALSHADGGNGLELARNWVKAQPGSAFAHFALGQALTHAAWKARGSGYANTVSEAGWRDFRKHLEEAERVLLRGCALDRTQAEGFSQLIWVNLGLGQPLEEARRSFDAAVAITPDHWDAHMGYLTACTAKWGGSDDEMFDFAYERAELRPRGDPLHALIPSAYNEVALACFDAEGPVEGAKMLDDPEYASDVVDAFYAWADATPENYNEVIAAQARAGTLGGYGSNQFAVALYLTGAHEHCRCMLRALNNRIRKTPWDWIVTNNIERSSSGFVYDRICKELGVVIELPTVREVLDGKKTI